MPAHLPPKFYRLQLLLKMDEYFNAVLKERRRELDMSEKKLLRFLDVRTGKEYYAPNKSCVYKLYKQFSEQEVNNYFVRPHEDYYHDY